jgi:hypothetical protein
VLSEVASTAEILKTEMFTPIALVVSFHDTQYSLASYAYTKDLSRAMRLVDSLEAGLTGMNTGLAERVALKASKSFERLSTCCVPGRPRGSFHLRRLKQLPRVRTTELLIRQIGRTILLIRLEPICFMSPG